MLKTKSKVHNEMCYKLSEKVGERHLECMHTHALAWIYTLYKQVSGQIYKKGNLFVAL